MRKFLLLVALLIAPTMASAQSRFTQTNPLGPNSVGLRVVEQYDYSRGYLGATDPNTGKPVTGERARPIQTLIWYPAERENGRAMRAGDYLRLGATAEKFGQTPAERARLEAGYVEQQLAGLPAKRAQAELAAPMIAHRDAAARPGRFPVVIYAPSFGGDAFENADLCEYLASFGYIVIASPSQGQWAGGMTTDLEGTEAQMGDIQYLIGYAHNLPQADLQHLAVMGYSWGGLANVMAAAKDPRIGALVSLDGSVRYWPDVVEQSRFLTPERVTAPLLYVASAPKQIEDLPVGWNKETSFLNKMKYADLYRVTMNPYVHANFAVMFSQRFGAESADANYGEGELSVANGWLETYVRRFLDGYLKGDAAGRAFLEAPVARSGAPAHLLTVYRRKAEGVPPTRTSFAAELARQGFAQASAIYREFKKRAPSFDISDDDLITWGYTLLGNGDVPASVAILRLDTELHADSWNAWDSLGDAYAKNGDKASAIEAYRKSVVLNPENRNGVEQLTALGARP
jgi:dienelactone hydrolase